jgi:hypothetical protein
MALLMQQYIQENERLMAEKNRLEKKLRDINIDADGVPDTSQLQDRICQLESELIELKQSSRDSKQGAAQDEALNIQQIETTHSHKHQMNNLDEEWDRERSSLREEIQRLNLENSRYRNGTAQNDTTADDDDDEEDEWTKRYQLSTTQSKDRAETLLDINELLLHSSSLESKDSTNNQNPSSNNNETQFDSSDISCLQSIITTLRQTIHQLTTEKESLQQRLTEEQTRSQQELQAFAKTLEGVDDLRSSAERMGRELRRIKVKGYRPVRSDLLNSSTTSSYHNSEEFQVADEASKEMEEAIRLIECQNDALNDRWSGRTDLNDIKVFSSEYHKAKRSSVSSTGGESKSSSLMKISEDECDDGFMCYWRSSKDEDVEQDGEKKKDKKANKEKRRKKKTSSGASVFSSFF